MAEEPVYPRYMTRAILDNSLREAVQAGTPVEVLDEATNRVYYLIFAEQFQRMAATLSGDFDPRELYPMIEKVMAEDDAKDPLLDSYQRGAATWSSSRFPTSKDEAGRSTRRRTERPR